MDDDTPAARYARATKSQEIGGTAGQEHHEVLERTLGRYEGLNAATGVDGRHQPAIVGGDAQTREPELERSDENREINEKKIERHGDVGGES